MARFAEVVAAPDTMSVIAQRLTDGQTLKDIAGAWRVPYGKLSEWIIEDRDRSEAYNRALKIWADSLAQETIQIADRAGTDKGEAAKAKLQVESRRWAASKWDRDRYGERSAVNLNVKNDGPVDREAVLLETARSLAFILAAGADVQERRRAPAERLALPERVVNEVPDGGSPEEPPI